MFVIPFSQISSDQADIIGQKALYLGQLLQAKFPVPEGYVVTTQAFHEALQVSDLHISIQAELNKINLQDLHSVDYASRVIQDLITAINLPENIRMEILQQSAHIFGDFVSVRSSAVAKGRLESSWTGELATFLHSDAAHILEHLKQCWASLYSTRSLYYILQKSIPFADLSLAVIIQRMIDSEVAGICYTTHPVTQDPNQLLIEAGIGLGEPMASGKVVPDTYVVKKDSLKILDKNISDQKIYVAAAEGDGTESREVSPTKELKQKLRNDNIVKLAKICMDVESFYQRPMEVEWALADQFYFLQARPIIGLS